MVNIKEVPVAYVEIKGNKNHPDIQRKADL